VLKGETVTMRCESLYRTDICFWACCAFVGDTSFVATLNFFPSPPNLASLPLVVVCCRRRLWRQPWKQAWEWGACCNACARSCVGTRTSGCKKMGRRVFDCVLRWGGGRLGQKPSYYPASPPPPSYASITLSKSWPARLSTHAI
jgi:hypothetical protein